MFIVITARLTNRLCKVWCQFYVEVVLATLGASGTKPLRSKKRPHLVFAKRQTVTELILVGDNPSACAARLVCIPRLRWPQTRIINATALGADRKSCEAYNSSSELELLVEGVIFRCVSKSSGFDRVANSFLVQHWLLGHLTIEGETRSKLGAL